MEQHGVQPEAVEEEGERGEGGEDAAVPVAVVVGEGRLPRPVESLPSRAMHLGASATPRLQGKSTLPSHRQPPGKSAKSGAPVLVPKDGWA